MDSYTEWKESNNAYLDDKGYQVPVSCCKGGNVKDEEKCQKDPTVDPGSLDSCYAKFEAAVSSHANIILAVAIVVVVIMVRVPLETLRVNSVLCCATILVRYIHFKQWPFGIIVILTTVPFQFMNMIFAFAMCTMAD